MSATYMIINKSNRQAFMDLLSKGTPVKGPHAEYRLSNPIPEAVVLRETKRMLLPGEIRKRWPGVEVVWKRLMGPHPHLVAEIHLPEGRYVVFRNGQNEHRYNIAVLDADHPTKFYFTNMVSEALDLVEILTAPDSDLPLFVGRAQESPVMMGILKLRCEGVPV